MTSMRLGRELGFAVRALRRTPLLTIASIATVVVGVGPLMAIFTVLYGVVLRPLSYPHADRLVQVIAVRTTTHQPTGFSLSELPDWEQGVPGLAAIAMYGTTGFTVTGGDAEPVRGAMVSRAFFPLLHPVTFAGRSLDESDATLPHAVVTQRLWARRFGSDAFVVDRSITLNGVAYSIVGLTSETFSFPTSDTDVWVPIGFVKTTLPEQWQMRGFRALSLVGLLAPDATIAQATGGVAARARSLAEQYPRFNQDVSASIAPLKATLSTQVRPALLILLAAVGCVWLIACANLANLGLARGAMRVREVAIRRALGATGGRIALQFLAEGAVLIAIGGAAALAVGAMVVNVFRRFAPFDFPRLNDVRLDAPLMLLALAVAALTTISFGVFPALRSARRVPDALREGRGTTNVSARRAHGTLIAVEMALALVLLVGASLFTRSLSALMHVETGVQSAGVWTMKLNMGGTGDVAQHSRLVARVLERVREVPGVEVPGLMSNLPPNVSQMRTSLTSSEPAGRATVLSVHVIAVAGDAFQSLGIPMLAGRAFRSADTADAARVVILSARAAAQLFPDRDPVGQQMPFGRNRVPAQVVGIAGDVKYAGLDAPVDGALYLPFAQQTFEAMYLTVRVNGHADVVAPALRPAIATVDPSLAVSDIRPLSTVMSTAAAEPRLRTILLDALTMLAVVLALVGLYGTTAYAVTQRIPEIGVRMALGARPRDIMRIVMSQGLYVTAVGATAGLCGVVLLRSIIGKFLFGVPANDPWSFGIALISMSLVGVVATWLPARRAARIDPAQTLRG